MALEKKKAQTRKHLKNNAGSFVERIGTEDKPGHKSVPQMQLQAPTDSDALSKEGVHDVGLASEKEAQVSLFVFLPSLFKDLHMQCASVLNTARQADICYSK